MSQILLNLCFFNTILIIMHEIDAAYWKEWKLFRSLGDKKPFQALDESTDQTGLAIFLIAHLPLLFVLLYGLLLVARGDGLWYSLFFSSFLIVHFIAHWLANKKGRVEFTWPVSRGIFLLTLFVSIGQLLVTITLLQ